jgi:hypothetical protein
MNTRLGLEREKIILPMRSIFVMSRNSDDVVVIVVACTMIPYKTLCITDIGLD